MARDTRSSPKGLFIMRFGRFIVWIVLVLVLGAHTSICLLKNEQFLINHQGV